MSNISCGAFEKLDKLINIENVKELIKDIEFCTIAEKLLAEDFFQISE